MRRIACNINGSWSTEGNSSELKTAVGRTMMHVRLLDADKRGPAITFLSNLLGEQALTNGDPGDPRAMTWRVSRPDRAPAALAALSDAGFAVAEFSLGQPSLDEVFLALTGRTPDDEDTASTVKPISSTVV